LILCLSGSVGHLVSITTLTSMMNPTNAFLISMSCSQLALCANFLYSTLFKWASDELCVPLFFSYYMVKTMHISVTLSVLVHMAGVFHVVALSIIRYCSLSRLANINSSQQWFTYQRCRIALVIIFVSVAVIGIPLHFTSKVVMVDENESCTVRYPALRNTTTYQLQFSSFPYLHTMNFWLFNFCSKIIPSVILCVMTFLILNQLKQIQQLSARFMNVKRDKQHQRTTKMILIIMFVFIIVELPQGLLAVLSTVTDLQLISALGDFTEMITLLTSCVIFALFCLMNGKIRSAFMEASCLRWLEQWPPKPLVSFCSETKPIHSS
uniref:G_PROTEIN_RECEP_F1_2 domain-containing protein n=1 Tax=Angiostrongylus cantonensis TaxID=6313 RepID=A0A0K0DFJ1_ANGCA